MLPKSTPRWVSLQHGRKRAARREPDGRLDMTALADKSDFLLVEPQAKRISLNPKLNKPL